jgi:ACS family hexuronate transporter-like MFS transporter
MATPRTMPAGSSPSGASRRTVAHLRWYVCGLLFFATTINYIDRQVLAILKPVLDRELHLTQSEYGWVLFGFQLSYAFVMPLAGRLVDYIGTRLGYAIAVLVWSLSAMGHALAQSAVQFGIARFMLGVGESGNFPAAFRTVADWFPQSERALAGGIFNGGSNIGALIAPVVVPMLALHFGWHSAFIFTGALGLLWLFFWFLIYRDPERHPRLSSGELTHIRSDNQAIHSVRIPWLRLLTERAALAFLAGKVITDGVWWFYLYWTPDFLHRKYGLNLKELGLPLVLIYLICDVGSVGGGWLSSALIKHGWNVTKARKTALLVCAVAVVSASFVPFAGGRLWLAVALIAIATACHQGWSANLYTMVSDTFPRPAVASVVGFGGFGGAVAGMITAPAIGVWLQWSHDFYAPLFIAAGLAYLTALAVIHLLLPVFRVVDVRQ